LDADSLVDLMSAAVRLRQSASNVHLIGNDRMLPVECPPGVVAGKLDSTVQKLRHVLADYREELNRATAAFQDWEDRWNERQREIDAHLDLISSRLGSKPQGPMLTVVSSDE